MPRKKKRDKESESVPDVTPPVIDRRLLQMLEAVRLAIGVTDARAAGEKPDVVAALRDKSDGLAAKALAEEEEE